MRNSLIHADAIAPLDERGGLDPVKIVVELSVDALDEENRGLKSIDLSFHNKVVVRHVAVAPSGQRKNAS